MNIIGIHHITLVSANARRTGDFYTGLLGLRLVKKTVNFDAPDRYHLYFGDAQGSPGSLLTFFEWPDARRGAPGIGGTHHVALQVAERAGLLRWKRRLTDAGLNVDGPLDRHYFESIYFRDPDGVILEIATRGPGWTIDEPLEALGEAYRQPPAEMVVRNRDEAAIAAQSWPEPVETITTEMSLQGGMHHITAIAADIQRTHAFYSGLLGLRLVKRTSNFDDPNSAHWYWGDATGRPGTLITYFERNPAVERRARLGAGQTHHFALAVENDEVQAAWREKLIRAGLRVSPVMDRVYFKSIYTQDPDGHIVELATRGPGFAVDEPEAGLGAGLMLPPWLESERAAIEVALEPIPA